VVLSGCGFQAQAVSGDRPGGDSPGGASPGSDSPVGQTDCFQHWFDGGSSLALSPPQQLTALSSAGNDRDPWISADGRRLYFDRDPGAHGKTDIYLANRNSPAEDFAGANPVDNLDTADDEGRCSLNADETILVFSGNHGTSSGRFQLFVSKRADMVQPLPSPSTPDQALVASVNTTTDNYFDPFLTKDGLTLYLAPLLAGSQQQITVTTRTGIDQDFPVSVPVPVINVANGGDADPAVSRDDRIIVFSSHRPAGAGFGATNLWYATRQSPTADFTTPRLIPNVNGDKDDGDPVLSDDGCELYFSSTRNGGKYHLFHAQVMP
jgi:Tol biopolymer transport system component